MRRRALYLLPMVLVLGWVAACEDDTATAPNASFDGGVRLPDGAPGLDGSPEDDANNDGDSGAHDGGADADVVPPLVPDYYVNPTTGNDANDGKTAAAAFKTLCAAKDVVTANQVIALADGSYDSNQRPPGWAFSYACGPTFAVPVRIVALSGTPVVKVPIHFNAGGEVRSIKLEYEVTDAGSAVGSGKIEASAGEVVLRGVSVGNVWSPPNAKSAPFVFDGTAKVTMHPGAVTNYATVPVPASKGFSFAFVTGAAELTVEGGTIDDSSLANADTYCNPLFEGSGKITLKGVTVHHKGSVARVTGGTFIATGGALDDRSVAFNVGCVPSIDLVSSAQVTLSNLSLGGGTFTAIGTTTHSSGTLSLANVTVSSFTDVAIKLSAFDAQPLAFSMRNSTVQGNNIGIRVDLGVVADLGTATSPVSPGNNVIKGNTTRGLESTATTTVKAAGNTWNVGQDTLGDGTYAAALKAGPESGINYSVTTGRSIQF